jgi:hypothetical protein
MRWTEKPKKEPGSGIVVTINLNVGSILFPLLNLLISNIQELKDKELGARNLFNIERVLCFPSVA